MKYLFILLCAMLVVSCGEAEEEISEEIIGTQNVPIEVTAAFGEKYPGAKDTEWAKEEEGIYEAEFEMDGKEYEAEFDAAGTWIKTEWEEEVEELPAAVKASLDSTYPGHEVEEAELFDSAELGIAYEVKIEMDTEGIDDIEKFVIIGEDGTIHREKNEDTKETKDEQGAY